LKPPAEQQAPGWITLLADRFEPSCSCLEFAGSVHRLDFGLEAIKAFTSWPWCFSGS